jgi:predicted metal-dependent peptidase
MELMKKARAQMMLKHPFFASLLMSMDSVAVPDGSVLPNGMPCPTMATDMKKIYYNPRWVEEELRETPKVMFVMAHEVMHVCLEHGLRRMRRNPILWNIAGDFAINLVLVDAGFDYPGNGCYDEKYKGWSADQIYEDLQKKVDKAKAKGGSGEPGKDGVPGFDELHGEEGDLIDPPGGDNPASQAELKRGIQQKVAQATQMARLAGKLPGELERIVGEILDPKVPWQDLLRDFVTRITKDDESWNRRNRRFGHVYLPSRWSERMGEIVIIGDTSGSIGNEELSKYACEVNSIIELLAPERIRMVWADTRVAGEQVFEEGETFKPIPKGGGGTDMTVPLRHVEKYEPEVVILLTDGYTPWPDRDPPYPLITCCTTEVDVPVGKTVRIK